MSRRVCETCAWFAAGEYEHGVCAYTNVVNVDSAMRWLFNARRAARRIRMSDDTCGNWEREEDDEHEAR